MTNNPLAWIGLAGVAPEDNARAHAWQARLHRAMVAIALLSLPAYLLDSAVGKPAYHVAATLLDAAILAAFVIELAWMMRVSSFPFRYLVENWLDVLVIVGCAASLVGAATEGIALVRVLRVAVAAMIFVRVVAGSRVLFTRRGAPLLTGVAVMAMVGGGALLYWLEPTVTTFWDGLWLAFVTGTTIGYGDLVPRTAAARVAAVFIGLIGWTLLSLFTANVVAFFVGREERELRRDLHVEILRLRADVARLIDEEELRLRHEIHNDMRSLHADLRKLSARLAELADERGR
jgi:voltage-gated potassium channel